MSAEFKIDTEKLLRAMRKSPTEAGKALTRTMDEIKDDWKKESVDIAPLDSGNLRRQITAVRTGSGMDTAVTGKGNATATTGRRFNYGYYIHEKNAGGKSLRRPGTVYKYLTTPADKHKGKWTKWLEEDVKKALGGVGWRI